MYVSSRIIESEYWRLGSWGKASDLAKHYREEGKSDVEVRKGVKLSEFPILARKLSHKIGI